VVASSVSFSSLLTVAVLGVMGFRLVTGLRVSRTGRGREVVAAVRTRAGWRHVWPVPLVLIAVLAVATPLLAVPVLRWGWWSALGGEGNPVFGSSDATSGTVWEWLIPLVFISLLVPALPLFANAEERMFRTGAEEWTRGRRVAKTLQFGLIHAVIGIPIGAALALSVGGAYFMLVYLREFRATGSTAESTLESTTAHAVYNLAIIGLVVVAVAATAAGW
jgi:hypothetical protein